MALPIEEAQHCVRVLRLRQGNVIQLTDGEGVIYDATLTDVSPKQCLLHIDREQRVERGWSGYIHIAVAPTKLMERNEWFVEKAVEFGVDEISFIKSDHSERDVIKTERIRKVAIAAMKQSQKAYLPKINDMVSFKSILGVDADERFIAHCATEAEKPMLHTIATPNSRTIVLIGPEGDFSPGEIATARNSGFSGVSLGPSRLRTETAALSAVHIMWIKKLNI